MILLNRDATYFSFLQFTGKLRVWELSNVIQAQINVHIAVRLSPKTSLYDLQKLRYTYRVMATASLAQLRIIGLNWVYI